MKHSSKVFPYCDEIRKPIYKDLHLAPHDRSSALEWDQRVAHDLHIHFGTMWVSMAELAETMTSELQ
jgi:hypothetical protein